MAKKTFLFFLFVTCLLAAGPALLADEAPEAPPQAPEAAPEPSVDVPEPTTAKKQEGYPLFENVLESELNKMKQEVSGCTASYPCVHGGSVNCSAPTGTCTSSGQGCGLVICNGNSTFCPGACNGNDWSCATFCYTTYGSMDGYCDSLKCCVCL